MSRVPVVRAVAPASIGNLGVGFDVLGACLGAPADTVEAAPSDRPGVVFDAIESGDVELPSEPERNTAGRAALAVLARAPQARGVRLRLVKGIPAAGGLGSSAASAVAAAAAVDRALELELGRTELLECALAGETVASGSRHGDNVAPCLLGGVVLVRSVDPLEVLELPVPDELAVAVLHPPVEVATRDARAALPARVPRDDASAQMADLAAFVTALFRSDYELLGRALRDRIAEPVRREMVPGFAAVMAAASAAGALGGSLSGAGPAMFALCRGAARARQVGAAMAEALRASTGLDGRLICGPVDRRGVRVEVGS